MARRVTQNVKERLIRGAREYEIATLLFRNAVSENLGVNVTDMQCLGLLFFRGLSTPSQLARHTGLTSGATTAMLDRLERSGLIERRPNPEDRRGTLIVLREDGAKQVGPWFASVRKAQDELLSSYDDSDLLVICDFFERATRIWEQERSIVQER
jgi:DNA-binding MarR family transcriptional regulator